jgi:hypothetical protein
MHGIEGDFFINKCIIIAKFSVSTIAVFWCDGSHIYKGITDS